MKGQFLANIFRMKHIDRWSLMYNTQKENLSVHSFECALLTHYLAVIGNTYFNKNYVADKLAARALFHDATEILTGDLPTPIKYFNKEISSVFHDIESQAAAKIVSYLPEEMQATYAGYFNHSGLNNEEKALIAAADKLCAFIKCISEINAGNKEFSMAYKTIKKQIYDSKVEELQYFLENCIDDFSLSLDELQGAL